MKFYEKLFILIVLFLGVTIGTASIIGVYAKTAREAEELNDPNSIVLEHINLF